MKEAKIESRLCRYVFSETEKKELAGDLANGVAELQRMEEQKKAVMSQLKSEIDTRQSAVNLAAEKLRSGFEMRQMDCEVNYDMESGVVRWIRTDNFEVAHSRRMTADERQLKLDEA